MISRLIHFVGSIFRYFFEDMTDHDKTANRREPTISAVSPPHDDTELPPIRLD